MESYILQDRGTLLKTRKWIGNMEDIYLSITNTISTLVCVYISLLKRTLGSGAIVQRSRAIDTIVMRHAMASVQMFGFGEGCSWG